MNTFQLKPIAFVRNIRKEIQDDNWAKVISEIVLTSAYPKEVLDGIEEFSHLAIIYYFHKVSEGKAKAVVRHPRNNQSWPKVGTFAQRNKNRPNRLGLTNVELVERIDNKLIVKNLDAIDGTPVLDIKPIMVEFEPKGVITQPQWSKELMHNYW